MAHRPKPPVTEPMTESRYWNRRQVLKALGFGTVAGAGALYIGRSMKSAWAAPSFNANERQVIFQPGVERPDILARFPAPRNEAFVLPGGVSQLTPKIHALTYNNFYEITTSKAAVWQLAQKLRVDPWTLAVTGECHKPRVFDLDDLFAIDHEERTYRFRCVEAWAMDVPWTGFPLHKLLDKVQPKSDAKYVRFITVNRPEQMPGIGRQPWYPWPYTEGLRMDEAMNELTLLTTGIFGQPLPRQNGAPARIVVPWKYGYKSAKSVVHIELLRDRPETFWHSLQPNEYPFLSNVDPATPHPRWSQATEINIATGNRRKTLPYNGYGEYVAGLYA